MSCCDYECKQCGWVEFSNFEPDKCPKCGGQLWTLVGWDEAKLQDREEEEPEEIDEDLCLDMEYPEDEELGNNGEPIENCQDGCDLAKEKYER